MKKKNFLWQFLASVQLAITNFVLLASTSVIGTIVPQNRIPQEYLDSYGTFLGQVFIILEFNNMYESWWFITLLTILAINLLVCSIDRFPATYKKVNSDGLAFSCEKVEKMKIQTTITTDLRANIDLQQVLKINNWPSKKAEKDVETLYFSQKNRRSHYGVYIVHISILVIFAGAIIGNILGFKGSVMIPELATADKIYSSKDSSVIDLDFQVRCNQFNLEYYDTGAPKSYLSSLTILEGDKEVLTTDIQVNKPLTYKGVTFYQASYEGFQDFIISIKDLKTGEIKSTTAVFQEQTVWEEKNLQLGILNAMASKQKVSKMKLWYYNNVGEPHTVWFENGETKKLPELDYEVFIKQKFATGLQVAKDPGVWLVYIGCLLLMLGLFISFFFSHQRIWLIERNGTLILVGKTNKNSSGFNKAFTTLSDNLKFQLQEK